MSGPHEQPRKIRFARRAALPYRAVLPTSPVTVRKCRDVYEAQLYANELAGHGIDYAILNP